MVCKKVSNMQTKERVIYTKQIENRMLEKNVMNSVFGVCYLIYIYQPCKKKKGGWKQKQPNRAYYW